MTKGISLHVGLNHLDTAHYKNVPQLKAAVNDALFWESFARSNGFQVLPPLHDQVATVAAVKTAIKAVADQLSAGDLFLLTYAGHGGQILNEKQEGLDKEDYDQTWCLYDRQMLDDEIYECFEAFKEGVRITVVSDSCHSGTITRAMDEINLSEALGTGLADMARSRGQVSRLLPADAVKRIIGFFYDEVYAPIQSQFQFKPQGENVKAAVTLLAACQDDQETLDGKSNGIFTEALSKLLASDNTLNRTAPQLIQDISSYYVSPRPFCFQYGSIIPSAEASSPFKIEIPDAATIKGYRSANIPPVAPAPAFDMNPAGWVDTEAKSKSAVLRLEFMGEMSDVMLKEGRSVKILFGPERSGETTQVEVEVPGIPMDQAWAAAHALQTALAAEGHATRVEPVLSVNLAPSALALSREADRNNADYIPEWPPATEPDRVKIGWHLDAQHSQLADANQTLLAKPGVSPKVRIAHLDTGYQEGHPALPEGLNTADAHNFVRNEDPNKAIDPENSGQDGHGLGTITLLAGGKVTPDDTFGEFQGYIGGAPHAEVIPMRISDSVVILNSNHFCDAVQRAIDLKCEVLTMSMAGKPDSRMAKMVDKAYEAGIVMVSAASNCWYKGTGALLPKCVLYPAAFPRVIAAVGAMYNHMPYDAEFLNTRSIGTKYMQGCWGPPARMKKALAAYTPNTPWASHPITFLRSGGGTSSATPQIAAAAALWIAYHRSELESRGYYKPENAWKKVEAVRNALFSSAEKIAVYEKYYGNGILRANAALSVGVPDDSVLKMSDRCEVALGGWWDIAKSFFLNRPLFRDQKIRPTEEALAEELLHLLHIEPSLAEAFAELDFSDPAAVKALLEDPQFRNKVMDSNYASGYLKECM